MKFKSIVLFFIILQFKIQAQTNDSLPIQKKEKITFQQFIIPSTLILGGTLLLKTPANEHLQAQIRAILGTNFHTTADNYLQLVPLSQIYTGNFLGFKSKNDFLHQSINICAANVITGITVTILKNSVKEIRPDESNNLSFPSGHTAIAFTNASLLYHEYKDSNFWYASSGFLFASATGFLRIANNKHYTSDVLAGAGIGLISGLLVSHWNPLQSLQWNTKNKTTSFIYPQLGKQIGIGCSISR